MGKIRKVKKKSGGRRGFTSEGRQGHAEHRDRAGTGERNFQAMYENGDGSPAGSKPVKQSSQSSAISGKGGFQSSAYNPNLSGSGSGSVSTGKKLKKIAKSRFSKYQRPQVSGSGSKAEYIDTRGKFDSRFSRRDENVTGSVTAGRTVSKVGDRAYARTAYLSGGKSFRGGSWDRTGRTFTPSRVSYTPKRSGAGTRQSPYTQSLIHI